MKAKVGLALLLLPLASFIVSGEDDFEAYRNARVVWETEEPTCFDNTLPLSERLDAVPRFMVGGEMTEPVRINAPKPTIEEMTDTGERPWVLVFELVISAAGDTELVVSLKDGFPRMEALVGRKFAQWTWEPTTINGNPVCTRYILTHRIHYQ